MVPTLNFRWLTSKIWQLPCMPILVFVIAATLYFYPYLTFDKILMGTDDGPRGWHSYGNHGHVIDSFSDKWSPLNGGTAIMERQFGRFLNPTHPLHLFLPKYKQRIFEYIFWTFLAGTFFFYYLRTVGISRSTALVLGLAFMFAPAFQSYIYAGHYARMQVMALLPGIMTLTERMLQKSTLLDLLALPILLAWCIYSEHLQLAYFTFLGVGIYFASRMIYGLLTRRITLLEGGKRTAYFSTALVIGCLITSMSTFPSIHHTYATSERKGGTDYAFASSFALHPEEVIALVEPDFIGWKERYWGQNPLKLNSEYFSGLILILALIGFLFHGQGCLKYLLGIIFLLALLFSLGAHTPLHRFLYRTLPGINVFRAPSLMHIWMFFPAYALAAMGLENIVRWGPGLAASLKGRIYIILCVASSLTLLYGVLSGGFARFWFYNMLPAQFQTANKLQALHANMSYILNGGLIVFMVVASFTYISYRQMNGKIKVPTYLMIFLILILVDQVRIARPFLTLSAKPVDFFNSQETLEHDISRYLNQKDATLYRVHSMLPDPKMVIPGLDMTYVFDDFTNQEYHQLIDDLKTTSQVAVRSKPTDKEALYNRFRNLLSHLNAKYVLSASHLTVPGLKEIFVSGPISVYQNMAVLPRVYLTSRIIQSAKPKLTLQKLISQSEWIKETAIVPNNSDAIDNLTPTVDPALADNVTISEYHIRKGLISLDITSKRQQMLVVADNYHPGWKAFVNGEETNVIPVNYNWKGIVVPLGKSKVAFVFNSTTALRWRYVTVVSGAVYILLALGIILIELQKRNRYASMER